MEDLHVDRTRDGDSDRKVIPCEEQPARRGEFRQILGIQFFVGEAQRAVDLLRNGGLLVVPAAPALKNLPVDTGYREALLGADLVITDSALMVMVWNFIQRDHIRRLSGLKYLVQLLMGSDLRERRRTFWIMASPVSASRNLEWLRHQGLNVPAEDVYLAPIYGPVIEDEALLERIRERCPTDIIVTIGGGTQERLGLYLKRNLKPLPAIHCIGAAIAFLSGDQIQIPMWADRCYLGWLFRCISEPKRYVPRYWAARKLIALMFRYRESLPVH
jgi:UDP-N-acetyl-D-mannosaminuronic acid transferase (WecB/TagA/CpsF family)